VRAIETSRSRGPIRDAGESLVELLVSIAIMGIAVTAILGGVGMAASSSSTHENLAQAQRLLRNWAESLTYSPACPAVVNAFSAPSGYTVNSPSVAYWSTTARAFSASCGAGGGMYRVTLSITPTGGQGAGIPQTLDVTMRRPCDGPVASPC
jgi:type II secretory pathway pseudopilin PulG